MSIERLDTYRFPVPFRVVFRHASASRAKAANIIVAARGGGGATGYGEGCPRDYVTGETVASAVAFIKKHEAAIANGVQDVDDLREWMQAHREEIDANPAAFCALEIAVLDLFGKIAQRPIDDLLGISRLAGTYGYSAVLGDASLSAYQRQAEQYWEMGFRDFKVKVSGDAEKDRRKLALLTSKGDPNLRIRLDANNLWRDAPVAIGYLKSLGTMSSPSKSRCTAEIWKDFDRWPGMRGQDHSGRKPGSHRAAQRAGRSGVMDRQSSCVQDGRNHSVAGIGERGSPARYRHHRGRAGGRNQHPHARLAGGDERASEIACRRGRRLRHVVAGARLNRA